VLPKKAPSQIDVAVRLTVRAMKAGAIEFLTKPFREQDLLDAVRVGLDRERARHQEKAANSQLQTRYESLSPREKAVLALITSGKMNKQAAAEIGIGEVTVKVQLHDLRRTSRSLMSRAGVPADTAERVLGHALPGIRGVYDRHAYKAEKADALRRLATLPGTILIPNDETSFPFNRR
jgi:FixJ family two-component response regulator